MPKLIDLEKIKPIDFPSTEMDGLDVVRYLNTLPTVDAVEVVNGHWISKGYKIECSVCEYREFLGTHDPVIHMEEKNIRKYFHNCGSKMDEEGRFAGICEHCAYREDCEWPKIHPKIKLKECPDFNKGDKK